MFAFCLPLGTQKRVLSQCPYKSPQSKAFQRLIICSNHLVRFYFYFVKALNMGYYGLQRFTTGSKSQRTLTIDPTGLEFIIAAIFEARNAKSWVSFDQTWLVLRDAYARCIFEGTLYINEFHATCLAKVGPLYDSTRGVFNITSEYRGDKNVSLTYFCIQDLTASVITSQSPEDAYGNNCYLQHILFAGNLKARLSTFSDYFEDPNAEFMQDENRFIFLFRSPHLSPSQLRHFAELHVRMMNYLYLQSPPRNTKANSPQERPTYPNLQLLKFYSKENDGEFLEHRKAFDETISSQFSLVIDTFFSMISNKNINEPDLLASFYGQPLGPMFQYLVGRQNTDSILKTLRTLTQAIKDFFPGSLGQRSDYFFYISAFYARSHWLESDAEQWSSNEDVKNLLITLHTYADSGHNRDKTLGKRLGIPNAQDKWWEFLNML